MGIERTTPKGVEKKWLEQRMRLLKQSICERLMYVGESALTEARTNHIYKDQTGNLTSSIGYAIIDDGKIIRQSTFQQVKSGGEGVTKGKQYLTQIISQNSQGIVFIMVAGMNYASYVEAMNLNVLDSAEVMAKKMIPRILQSLKL